MNPRKTVSILLLTCIASLTLPVAADQTPHTELSFSFQALLPQKTEHWDAAGAAETQITFWPSTILGIGLSAGIQQWDAPYEYAIDEDANSSLAFTSEGTASAFPIGASLFLRLPLADRVNLLLEGGLRYMFIDSDIWITTTYSDAYEISCIAERVEIDDALVGVAGVRIQAVLGDGVSAFCGLGYQADFSSPEETAFGEPLDQTDFSAASLSIGIAFLF